MAKASSVNPTRRFLLGILIILPAFVMIGAMFFIQHTTSLETIDTVKDLIASGKDSDVIKATADAFDDVNSSNQSFFNIILAIFAAWVGAVVAFYFGSENLQQAQQTLKEALTAKQELSQKTISDILKKFPGAKSVRTISLDSKISEVRKELQTITNVLVVNDKKSPIGVLYRWDLVDQANIKLSEESQKDEKKLSDVIEEIKKEYVTGKAWSKTDGIKNFAELSKTDNLLQAKQKMDDLAKSPEILLSVRGIVVEDSKAVAIVNFANLTDGIV